MVRGQRDNITAAFVLDLNLAVVEHRAKGKDLSSGFVLDFKPSGHQPMGTILGARERRHASHFSSSASSGAVKTSFVSLCKVRRLKKMCVFFNPS
jgi:hypothetical protein